MTKIYQKVYRLFDLSLENNNDRIARAEYSLLKIEIKDYNVMIDGQNLFDQSAKDNMRTYENIQKTATGQEDDYTIGYLLDYPYLEEHYKMIAIDLSK